MKDDRIERATRRIENALARIAAIADRQDERLDDGPDGNPTSTSVNALVERYETLHETAASTLDDMDKLIAELAG